MKKTIIITLGIVALFMGLVLAATWQDTQQIREQVSNEEDISWINAYGVVVRVLQEEFPQCQTTSFAQTLSADNGILLREDVTGDGVAEAMILTGCTGAYTTEAALFGMVEGEPSLLSFLGGNREPIEQVFVAGASVMNYLRVGMDRELRAVWQAHGSLSPADCTVSWDITAYQWREEAGVFQEQDSLAAAIQEKHADNFAPYYDPREGFSQTPVENCDFSSSVAPSPQPPAPSDVAGWQTYRNDEHGFEVRYPNEWQFEEQENRVNFTHKGKEYGFEGGRDI